MPSTVYLMFSRGGDLAGLERGFPADEGCARGEAARLLDRDADVDAVEIWRGGRLVDAVRD